MSQFVMCAEENAASVNNLGEQEKNLSQTYSLRDS